MKGIGCCKLGGLLLLSYGISFKIVGPVFTSLFVIINNKVFVIFICVVQKLNTVNKLRITKNTVSYQLVG